MNHYVGIDNSSLNHKVKIIDEKSNQKLSFTITNNYEGFEELHKKLNCFDNKKIAFEMPYGPLVDYLHFKNYNLYSLNPLKVKRYKETVKVSGNKNDDIDALAIAEYLKNNISHTRELIYNSAEIEKLKNLSMIHTRLTEEHTRYLNKLRSCINQYFPIHNSFFVNFGRIIQVKLILRYPNFEELRSARNEDLNEFFTKNKYYGQTKIDKIINKIRSSNQLVSKEVEYAYRFEAQTLCQILLILKENLKTVEKEMNFITVTHPLGKYFESLPGAGNILSCKLLALFGDYKDRFADYSGAQCLFGTAPKNYQSGNYHKVIMRKACDKKGRAILYHFAFASMRYSKWASDYYKSQRSRGKTHSVAVRALSNKWVKIIFKIWKDELYYQEDKIISTAA